MRRSAFWFCRRAFVLFPLKRRYVNQIVNFQICDSTSGKTIRKAVDIPKSTNPIVNFL